VSRAATTTSIHMGLGIHQPPAVRPAISSRNIRVFHLHSKVIQGKHVLRLPA
jgi:hypothetical protein